jgi:hypothetical protein
LLKNSYFETRLHTFFLQSTSIPEIYGKYLI